MFIDLKFETFFSNYFTGTGNVRNGMGTGTERERKNYVIKNRKIKNLMYYLL